MTMPSIPRVIVLVLSFNGKQWLEECLPSVLAMDYPRFEVMVIDNGSTDGTAEYLQQEFPQVQIVTIYPNAGYARGFNAGLEIAATRGADYFLVMNNDTVIDRGALTALVQTALSRDRAGFVTGKVYFYDRPTILQTVGKEEHPMLWSGKEIGWDEDDRGQHESIAERAFADDVYTLVSREMYDEVGGYDPQFFLQCEEWDWQVRAKLKGWRIYYTPHAMLWHRLSATTGGLGNPISEYFLYRNRIVVIAKHGGTGRILRYFVWGGFRLFIGFLRELVHFDSAMIKPQLARVLGFLGGTWWLVRRQPSTKAPWLIRRLADQ